MNGLLRNFDPRSPKRRGAEIDPELIQRLLGESPDGLSVVALARRAGVGEPAVAQRLIDLERAGQVRRSGSRRTSRWRWMSDEERIAERAAELSAGPAPGGPRRRASPRSAE